MCAQNLRPHLDVGQLHGWGTMPKTLKSAAELAEMIVVELRKHSECDTIKPIRITLPATKNWDITTRYDRTKLPSKGYKILSVTAQRLQALYDLPKGSLIRSCHAPISTLLIIIDERFMKLIRCELGMSATISAKTNMIRTLETPD